MDGRPCGRRVMTRVRRAAAAGRADRGSSPLLVACGGAASYAAPDGAVIVLGIDGLDYHLMRDLIGQGRLPNLARLARRARFTPLATSIPPQSPVAWSTFITGLDPGEHGIFDFIHRDPETLESYLSTTRTDAAGRIVDARPLAVPAARPAGSSCCAGARRSGRCSRRAAIETTIMRMPANFPPSGTATRELSGMGTPDMLGTYGTSRSSRPSRRRSSGRTSRAA